MRLKLFCFFCEREIIGEKFSTKIGSKNYWAIYYFHYGLILYRSLERFKCKKHKKISSKIARRKYLCLCVVYYTNIHIICILCTFQIIDSFCPEWVVFIFIPYTVFFCLTMRPSNNKSINIHTDYYYKWKTSHNME